ncbi:Alpha/beta-hydrolase [Mycena venus]|uniref:Alpha/beta-hydrolase n=1 Tax=Mycena venus TaxID=2733690 RepID=A0A8H7D5T5_9AGAR|nr:Alpha/beta-hydrolase [Mycena venus]
MLLSEDIILPSVLEDGPLKLCAKRYSPAHVPERKQRVALIFLPNIGAHCETWQTSIERLFQIQHVCKRRTKVVVSEAWALEYPDHGRAVILNEHALVAPNAKPDAHWFARAISRFMNSGLVNVDAIISVGYSDSTSVIISATKGMDLKNLPMLILVEPLLITPDAQARFRQGGPNSPLQTTIKRQCYIWPSREDARHWMSRQSPWKDWEPQVLAHFVEFALRDLPTATYPDTSNGVTPCWTQQKEVISYALDSTDRITELCGVLPVHCIFGAKNDFAAESQQALIDLRCGRRMASITRIPGAGHLVVQEQPFKLAERIFAILNPEDYNVCKL